MLDKVLTYHVVPGRYTAQQIGTLAKRRGGTATLKTVEGGNLKFTKSVGSSWVIDAKGDKARIAIPNVVLG